ncbi:unnamed protein product [Arctia plantaginis]|uniref:Uncharacterized protein n=1 Tax=Arctia plantaginis TaxID=874455 RepID=A0A8S0ZVZ4_ARCPL|nr:unnamed protein product [Arctia plantaginis]
MWEKISRTLNRVDQDQARSGHSWHRYWLDLKFKVRRKYSVIQKCQVEGTHCTILLSPLEDRIVKVLTDDKGNLFPIGSIYHQMLQYPLKESTNNKLKPISDLGRKIDDVININDVTEDTREDFTTIENDHRPEHILLPDSSDVKPTVDRLKHIPDVDPIQILAEEKKPIEELRRELVEFELRKQKELFEMEKQHKREKHEMEMSILMIKKQIMTKELNKL